MSIRKLRAGRVSGATQAEYIGEKGTIFWDEETGYLYLSDGITPGGHDIGLPVATSSRLGGIKLGPGVITNSEGQVIIDSTGLDFSFGDFQATTPDNGGAVLSSRQTNQNIDVVSNGAGVINIFGGFHVHRPEDYDPETDDIAIPVFTVNPDGQVQMKVPLADSTTAALEIVGNDSGLFLPPNQTGVILHVTGNSGLVSRNYFDANASYALLAGRRYNGTQSAPRRVLNNEMLFRLVAQAATANNNSSDAVFQTYGPARISFYANEDQTPTAQGGRIAFEITKNGTTADSTGTNTITVATFDAQNGLTATQFNGPLTGNVTGNVSGNAGTVTNGVYTNGSYANPSWITSLAASKVGLGNVENTALSTSTHYIGTTSIQYNRSSGAQTLTGVSIDGNAATVTNGVYTSGDQTIGGTKTFSSTISGSITGNAGTVTNGVYTSGSYSDPSWLTISKSKVGLGNVENTALSTSTFYLGTTQITYNRASGAQTLAGVSVSGNAGTVTNGVYTTDTGTVTNTMLAGSIANNKLSNSTISGIALGSNLATLTFGTHLTGTSYNGSTGVTIATDATNANTASTIVARDSSGNFTAGQITASKLIINDGGLRTVSGGTAVTIDFSVDSIILWTAPSGTGTVTLSNYTPGATVKLIIALTTSRDINYGVTDGAHSSDAATSFNGSGAGSVSIANTAMHLSYTCIDNTAAGCYVAVTVL